MEVGLQSNMANSISKLVEMLNQGEKRSALLLLLFMLGGALLEVISLGMIPAFIAIVADFSIIERFSILQNITRIFQINNQQDLIWKGSISLIFIFIIKNIYITILLLKRSEFSAKVQYRLSSSLLNLYYNAPYTFHLNRNSSDLFSKVSDEVKIIVMGILLPALGLIMDIIFAISTILILLVYEPGISLVSLLIFLVTGILYWFMVRKKTLAFGSQLTDIRSEMYKRIYEGFGGLKDAKILNREKYFLEATKKSFTKTINATKFQQNVSAVSRPFIETIAVIGMLVIVLVLLYQNRPLHEVLSVLALFAIASIRLLPAINQIMVGFSGIRSFLYTINPVYNDIKELEHESLNLKYHPVNKIPFENAFELKNLTYTYPNNDKPAIYNLSLSIEKGTAIAIVGKSGSGKTTLVDIILGLLHPEKGEIKVDNRNIKDDIRSWQQQIGYIPQQIFLSDSSIKQNIAFGIEENKIDLVKLNRAIAASQLETLMEELPDGVETLIGERGVRLSGGQRQRIGIARALYHDPQILIMDEATSALDNITERYIIEAIDRLKGGRTIITIAHRLSTVKNCDTLYLMKEGVITHSGSYDDLLKHSNEFKEMNI